VDLLAIFAEHTFSCCTLKPQRITKIFPLILMALKIQAASRADRRLTHRAAKTIIFVAFIPMRTFQKDH
jgi:hypothetical protein